MYFQPGQKDKKFYQRGLPGSLSGDPGKDKDFSANKTPHAFVIWKENSKWTIEYSGSLDDNGAEPSKVIHAYISEAVENLLAGKKVSIPATNSIGCEIHYRL